VRTLRLLAASLLVACSSSSPPERPAPVTTPSPATGATTYVAVRPDDTECLPRALPTAADGTTTCRMLALLPDRFTCDTAGGVSPAPDDDVTVLAARLALSDAGPMGPLCLVPQRPARCSDEDGVAFCYAPGGCSDSPATWCDQSLCTTSHFARAFPYGTLLYLACASVTDAG
jgi:hypothetical protein